jgi:F420-0:gamma-glutamyl ligase
MRKTMKVTPVRTNIFEAGQNIGEFCARHFRELEPKENSIFVVTSKLLSLAENRIVPKDSVDKQDLIKKEADVDLGEVAFGCRLTIKHGLFIPSAGIDESNSVGGDYLLFPENPFASAHRLHQELKAVFDLKNFGVLITDSHTMPLRQGVTGIALSYWGFHGVKDMIGRKDLFGRELKMTKMDLADGLASAAVLMMGEADEASPLALIEDAPVEYCETTDPTEIQIPYQMDLYLPLFESRLARPLP